MTRSGPRRLRLTAAVGLALVALFVVGGAPAGAHEGDEGIVVVADDERVIVTAPVAFEQVGFVDSTGDGLVDRDELATQQATIAPSLVDAARDRATLSVDGRPLPIIGAGVPGLSDEAVEASAYVVLVLASEPHDGEIAELELGWGFDSPSGAVVLSSADDVVTGELGDDGTAFFSLSTWSSVRSFFALGVDHIRYGPDHLLFLLVLTLAATGTTITASTTWRVVKLVTAFTLGHAVSLSLAYFGVVSIPAWIVEPAISLSIVVAAVLAIRGGSSEARPWLAGLVGVVHGLGFASNLSSLGVVASQRIAALAAFNLGVDVAQTVVVLAVIAVLWVGARVLDYRVSWVRTAGALGAGVFGLVWTVGRLAELSS